MRKMPAAMPASRNNSYSNGRRDFFGLYNSVLSAYNHAGLCLDRTRNPIHM